MGLKADVKNVTFDSIIPGLAANKYDLGMSSFTDHQGAREDGRLRHLRDRRARRSTSRPTAARTSSRSPTSAATRSPRSGEPPRRTTRPRRTRSARRPASPASTSRSSPTRTASTWRCRAVAPTSPWPTRRPPPTPSSSRTASSSSPASRTARRPTGSRCRRTAAWRSRCSAPLKAVMADGTYEKIFDYWGLLRTATRSTQPEINPTNVPAS